MSDIQNIIILSTQTVEKPKPHTTYTIQISTSTRTWTVDRRYNDFCALDAELVSSVGSQPPSRLPPKHNLWKTRNEKTTRERRVQLEMYLRAILTTKDARWRQAFGFQDFLSIPTSSSSTSGQASTSISTKNPNINQNSKAIMTPATWLNEATSIQSLLRSTRASLLKRDALALQMSDPAGARSANVEAKRLLKDAAGRLDVLERGLVELSAMGEGERQRRLDMVSNLQAERGDLSRMAEAGVRSSLIQTVAQPAGSGSSISSPGNSGTITGRTFGQRPPPQETESTRPLDDRGLLQLQQTQISNQDAQLTQLSQLLNKQKTMGHLIGSEIERQNEELDELSTDVGRVGVKLGRAKRDLNKLS